MWESCVLFEKKLLHGFRFTFASFILDRRRAAGKNIVGHVVHSAVCNYPISNCGLGVLATNIFRTHCSTCPQKYQQSRSIPIINLHQINQNHNAMANHLLFQFKLEGECLTLASILITLMYLMSLISTSAVEDLKQKSLKHANHHPILNKHKLITKPFIARELV